MDAVEFIKTRARICSFSDCGVDGSCPLAGICECLESPQDAEICAELAVEAVEKWIKEHPFEMQIEM